uniref:Uncharacterized protein n=1 Tax=Glossina brevipalpis TaxID=37001 RepID=A0A1A9WYA0_9MUSC
MELKNSDSCPLQSPLIDYQSACCLVTELNRCDIPCDPINIDISTSTYVLFQTNALKASDFLIV